MASEYQTKASTIQVIYHWNAKYFVQFSDDCLKTGPKMHLCPKQTVVSVFCMDQQFEHRTFKSSVFGCLLHLI